MFLADGQCSNDLLGDVDAQGLRLDGGKHDCLLCGRGGAKAEEAGEGNVLSDAILQVVYDPECGNEEGARRSGGGGGRRGKRVKRSDN